MLVTTRDDKRCTPLHCVLRQKLWHVARILVADGADQLDPDPLGNTSLHYFLSPSIGRVLITICSKKLSNLASA